MKMHTNNKVAIKPIFMSSFMCCISLYINHSQILNLHNKIPKDSLFIFLVLNAVFVNLYHVKAVQDDISAKTVPT